MKWQRKLSPPKTSKSFYEFYDRARALEEQERQYAVSAGAHQVKSDKRVRSLKDNHPPPGDVSDDDQPKTSGKTSFQLLHTVIAARRFTTSIARARGGGRRHFADL